MKTPVGLEKITEALRINKIKRHMFLCIGDKCCSSDEGMKVWDYLKSRCKSNESVEAGVYRTKVGCLRVCRDGPIAVVYPEGVWYRNVSVDVCEQIFTEHLLGGRIVEEYQFAGPTNPELILGHAP